MTRKEWARGNRIADLIQRELALLLQREVKDPRLGLVTLNEVRVSRDLAFADVYYTVIESEPAAAQQVLEHAGGFLRSALSKVLSTRTTPRLRFHFDRTLETGTRMSQLIDHAVREDELRAGERATPMTGGADADAVVGEGGH